MSKEEFNPYVVLMVPKKYFGNIKDEVGVKSLEMIINQNKEDEKWDYYSGLPSPSFYQK